MDSTAEKLLRDIADAFADVRRGNGTTWLEGEELDCHGTPAELAAARALDTDQRWQDVPDGRFERYSSPVWFLDAEGFRYYLPAIMTWAMRSAKPGVTEDNLLYLLNDKERQAWLEEGLSLPQLRATADWVWYRTEEWLNDRLTADLRQFWSRYRRAPGT
jgi:hypothetical protein